MFILMIPLNLIINRRKHKSDLHKSRNEIHDYWKSPDDGMNLPENYSKVNGEEQAISRDLRSQFLIKMMDAHSNSEENILEIGCNVGRNLHYLYEAGYKNLNGIDISKNAIILMKNTYPRMVKNVKIINRSIEEGIRDYKNNEFEVVFTMAVLEHIHPDSEFIFSEMVRITKNLLITIEDEKHVSWRHFPRNYKHIFEPLGMEQIYEHHCKKKDGLGPNFRARIFLKQYDKKNKQKL